MSEIWKPIENYEDYFISSFGNVKSTKKWNGTSERILKPGITKKGYCLVVLRKNGESKYFSVHRLVAKAFIPNPENFDQVNHINEIKTDNRVENLEWCDGKYNMNYGSRRSKQIQKVSKPVLCVETNTVYRSTVHASKELSISQGNISRCCLGKAKTCGGFHWKYI